MLIREIRVVSLVESFQERTFGAVRRRREELVTIESEKVSGNTQKSIRELYLLGWCFKAHSA
jgi:hypothetical protein